MNLNKLLIAGSVFTVLFIISFSVMLFLQEVGNMNEASQYCDERDKVSIKISGNTYICVEPEDKV